MNKSDRLFANKHKKATTDSVYIGKAISINKKNNGIVILKFLDSVRSNMSVLNSIILLVIFFIAATLILVSNELHYI